jgi:branched-subunit amino acid transport protein
MAMSLIAFAGAAQFAVIGYLAAGISWPLIAILTALLNARHLLYSAALAPWFRDRPFAERAVAAHVLTDEAFALAIAHARRIGRFDPFGYWYGAVAATLIPWNVATLAGGMIGGDRRRADRGGCVAGGERDRRSHRRRGAGAARRSPRAVATDQPSGARMTTDLVPLAVLMWAVTYPSRAAGLLAPAVDRLPRPAFEYLQLVGPSVLAALAVVNTVLATRADGSSVLVVGLPWLAVGLCIALVAWRKSLLVGLVMAVAVAIAGRTTGLA